MMYKIKVVIDGRGYTLSSENNDGYIEKVAEYVDAQIGSSRAFGRSVRPVQE